MHFAGKTAIITGAAQGIGKALAIRFLQNGAKIMIADRSVARLSKTAQELDVSYFECDVRKESDVEALVKETNQQLGSVDVFCSNAGLAYGEEGNSTSASNDQWQTSFDVHVMAQVYAARHTLPFMIKRGEGHIINMASAAGLLSQIGDAAYSATKHASIGFSESLAITHGTDGIKVSVICPEYIATELTGYKDNDEHSLSDGTISVSKAADIIMEGIINEQFMITTHEGTLPSFKRKSDNYEHWISGMQKLRGKIINAVGSTSLKDMHKLF